MRTSQVVIHSRRGTVILEPDHPLTVGQMDGVIKEMRQALRSGSRLILLDGTMHVTGIIPPVPRPIRARQHRPRWARRQR